MPSGKQSRVAVWSYVLYNFGRTPFILTILTLYFPLWLTEQYGAGPALFNYATAAASLLVVLMAPALGALCDLHQSRLRSLVALTLITVLFTLALGFIHDLTESLSVAVTMFVIAGVAYNLINVPFYALLPGVAEGRGTGRVSGDTQAAGFAGSLLAMLAFGLFVAPWQLFGRTIGGPEQIREHFSYLGVWVHTSNAAADSNTFLPTALFFLVFALPAFFFVPDAAARAPQPARLVDAYRSVFATLRHLRAYPGLGTFMAVRLLFAGATFVAIPNMCLYAKSVFGMGEGQIGLLVSLSLVFSVISAFSAGRICDRAGPRATLLAILALWFGGLGILVLAWSPAVFYVASAVMFLANGATLAVGTVLLLALAPRDRVTEFMGFFVTVGQVAAALWPVVLGLLLEGFGEFGTGVAYRVALGSLAAAMAVAMVLLLRVPDARTLG